MDKRKLFGTIIGLIFWSFCVIFFTYAYYDWRSDPTNVVLGIEDLSLECLVGADVEVSNIGPVLNYQDGVKTEFSINNAMTDNMTIELYLDITSMSDNLLTDSLKYVLVADSTGGTNYDYNNPVLEGDFSNFNIGNNLVTQDLEVTAEITTNYQFIIYIDGNMYNNPNMQENNISANLLVGNCGENAVQYNELVYQAIYSETDNSLTFVHTTPLTVGETYNDKAVTAVYTGFETADYVNDKTKVPWYSVRENIEIVNFDSIIKPKSTASWFYGFNNLTNINLEKLDTSKVTNMSGMFRNCISLLELDLSNFDTSNVTDMNLMFAGQYIPDTSSHLIMKLITIDLSSFDTSNVKNMTHMFSNCRGLKNIDLSNFDTSNVTAMASMFYFCLGLSELDLSNWDTSNVTTMGGMFQYCNNLKSLNVSRWNTKKVTNMSAMFYNCINLISIDLSDFDTSNVTSMRNMFQSDFSSKLKELDLSNFDTKNVTDMAYMFGNNTSLTNLNLSGWNTIKVTDMSGMFGNCTMLEMIIGVEDLNTSNVTSMGEYKNSGSNIYRGMFENCYKLTATITIRNPNTTYLNIFHNAATAEGAKITVNYTSETSSLVDSIIASKSSSSNVVKGSCIGDNCSV